MKRTRTAFILLALLVLNYHGFSAILVSKAEPSNRIDTVERYQLSKEDQTRITQMKVLSSLTTEKYEELRGKKLNFFQRLAFNASKHRMKNMLKHYADGDSPTILQKISWLLKGVLLGPIALLAGYLFLKGDERELIKWIWFGFAGFALIIAIILLA